MSDLRARAYPPIATVVVAIVCATLLRVAIEPLLHGTLVWLTFWPAVFLAAWFGGWRAGVATIAAALAIVGAWWASGLNVTIAAGIAGASVFVLCGLAFCHVSHVARLAYEDERRLRQGYLAFATALSNAGRPEQVAAALVDESARTFGADVVVFARLVDGDCLELIAQRGLDPPPPVRKRLPPSAEGLLGTVLRTGREYLVETEQVLHAAFAEEALRRDPVSKATAALPLKVGDRVVGAVALRFRSERRFSAEERDLLRTLVAQSAQAFERASLLEKERAAGQAKDQFLAMLAHELRNPLAPITTALDLLQLRGNSGASRELAVIARQVEHLARMVDDLLDVSRISASKIELQCQPIEVHDLVSRAVETVAPQLKQRGHQLTVEVPRSDLRVDADEARIGQVLGNILANAVKYTDPRGQIRVSARPEGAHVVIDIVDDGVGIEPALLPYVFEPFTQEVQSLARSRGGLGLGLAIARKLVHLHRGEIAVHSEGKGRGTRVTVRLPRFSPLGDAPASFQVAPPVPPRQRRRRVLVVDDNRDAAEMLSTLVTERGHETRCAHNGPDALGLVKDFVPEVALLDLGLPTMDGYELARQLRRAPQLAGCRLVAVTGYGQPADRVRSREAGFDLHLVKPIQLLDVIRAIEDDLPASGQRGGTEAPPSVAS